MNTLIFVLLFCSTSDVAGCECVTVTLGRPGENAQIEKKIVMPIFSYVIVLPLPRYSSVMKTKRILSKARRFNIIFLFYYF